MESQRWKAATGSAFSFHRRKLQQPERTILMEFLIYVYIYINMNFQRLAISLAHAYYVNFEFTFLADLSRCRCGKNFIKTAMQPLNLMNSLSSCLALLSAPNACQLHLPGPGLSAAPPTSSVLPVINQLMLLNISPCFSAFGLRRMASSCQCRWQFSFPYTFFRAYMYMDAFRHIIFYVLGVDRAWEISLISTRHWLSFARFFLALSAISSTWVVGLQFISSCWHSRVSSCICLMRQVWLESQNLQQTLKSFREAINLT